MLITIAIACLVYGILQLFRWQRKGQKAFGLTLSLVAIGVLWLIEPIHHQRLVDHTKQKWPWHADGMILPIAHQDAGYPSHYDAKIWKSYSDVKLYRHHTMPLSQLDSFISYYQSSKEPALRKMFRLSLDARIDMNVFNRIRKALASEGVEKLGLQYAARDQQGLNELYVRTPNPFAHKTYGERAQAMAIDTYWVKPTFIEHNSTKLHNTQVVQKLEMAILQRRTIIFHVANRANVERWMWFYNLYHELLQQAREILAESRWGMRFEDLRATKLDSLLLSAPNMCKELVKKELP